MRAIIDFKLGFAAHPATSRLCLCSSVSSRWKNAASRAIS